MLGIREKNMSISKKKVDKKFRRIEVKYCVKYLRNFFGRYSLKQSFFRSKKSNFLVFRSRNAKNKV